MTVICLALSGYFYLKLYNNIVTDILVRERISIYEAQSVHFYSLFSEEFVLRMSGGSV